MKKTDDKRADQSPAAGKRLAWSQPKLRDVSIASETQAGGPGTTDSGILS